jgi:16S rRNA (adenine(1408)-N(1))-methyltransferase
MLAPRARTLPAVHLVVGRKTSLIDAPWVRARAAGYARTIVDLGTGDGRAVIVEATADPGALVVGIDADARTMAELSRRASAAPAKGGHPNAIFVASGVELLPPDLDGIADRLTVRFPWGSLLRGAIGVDPAVSASIARLVRVTGTLELALSIVEHDRLGTRDAAADATADAATTDAAATDAGARADAAFARLGRPFDESDIERIRAVFGGLGLRLAGAEPMTREEVAAYGSSWARRLRVGRDRAAWRVRLTR